MLSFIVPAHNEELLIGRTLHALSAAGGAVGEPFEVIVVDDASSDRTGEIAARHGARVVRIERRQIAAARNAGARATTRTGPGDTLVFVDADTVVPEATLRAAIDVLQRGAAGGGAYVRFDGEVPRWARVMLGVILVIFRALRLAGGCFIFCSRDAFEHAGGWDETVFASEELLMSQALKRCGRFVLLPQPVITSGRKVRAYSAREILTTLARIGIKGPGAVRSRQGLEMWYGPRRADPQP